MSSAPELQDEDPQSALVELIETLENAALWYRGHLSELHQARRGQLPKVGRSTMEACLDELPPAMKPAKMAERILIEVFQRSGFAHIELQSYVNKARKRRAQHPE